LCLFLAGRFVPGSSFLGVAHTGSARALRLRVLRALGALGDRHSRRPPTASPPVTCS